MVRTAVPGEALIDHFSVFEDDGYTKRSGLTDSDFAVSVWANAMPLGIATAVAEIAGGEYQLGFVPTIAGIWKVEIHVLYNHEILAMEVEVRDADVDSINYELSLIKDGGSGDFNPATDSLHAQSLSLARILGLLHHNAILDNQTYDAYGNLASARLRVFDTKGNVPAVPGGGETVGLLHQYTIEAEHAGLGAATLFKLVREI